MRMTRRPHGLCAYPTRVLHMYYVSVYDVLSDDTLGNAIRHCPRNETYM